MFGSLSITFSCLGPGGTVPPFGLNIGDAAARNKPRAAFPRWAVLLCLLPLAACTRESEAALRDRLAAWVSLGETVDFAARMDCAAAAFRVTDPQVKAALPLAQSLPEALITLRRLGRMALDDPRQSPDRAMVDAANTDRPVGMAMRRAALEARACMTPDMAEAFHAALTAPGAVLIWDAQTATLVLLDGARGLALAAMGGR